MRVRVADAASLRDLCDYLAVQGYVTVETSEGKADVLMPTPGDLEAAAKRLVWWSSSTRRWTAT